MSVHDGRRRRSWRAGGALAVALALAAAAPGAEAQPRTAPLADVLAGAGAYVQRFVREFAVMIADEKYAQWVRRGGAPQTRYATPVEARRMTSEVLFMWVPDDRTWLTARNVREVDRRPVTDSGERLERVLADTRRGSVAQARRLRDEGARFNLGIVERNISDPTLALQFLDPALQPRFAFTLDGRESVDGEPAWRLRYVERATPTLVSSEDRDLPASGEVWIAQDGAVLRTRLRVEDEPTTASGFIEVSYRRDRRFDIRTPRQMTELYQQRVPLRSRLGALVGYRYERIDCIAEYENFRRFDAEVRIVP